MPPSPSAEDRVVSEAIDIQFNDESSPPFAVSQSMVAARVFITWVASAFAAGEAPVSNPSAIRQTAHSPGTADKSFDQDSSFCESVVDDHRARDCRQLVTYEPWR